MSVLYFGGIAISRYNSLHATEIVYGKGRKWCKRVCRGFLKGFLGRESYKRKIHNHHIELGSGRSLILELIGDASPVDERLILAA